MHIFLYKLSNLAISPRLFDERIDNKIYNDIELLPDTKFDWPITEMAHFEFNNPDELVSFERVIVVIGIPITNDTKLLQVIQELFTTYLFNELEVVLYAHIPLDDNNTSKGCAIIEFGKSIDVNIMCKAIEEFPFGDNVLHARPFSDLSSNEDEEIKLDNTIVLPVSPSHYDDSDDGINII